MGGIPTNYMGEVVTSKNGALKVVEGLMAMGETACVSVHGANRLGSNSLLDLIVFGRAAAIRAAAILKPNTPHKKLAANAGEEGIARFDIIGNSKGISTSKIRKEMQSVMQRHASVFRDGTIMQEGCKKVQTLFAYFEEVGIQDRGMVWNSDLVEMLELDNLRSQAVVTIESALNRNESR